MIDWPKTDGKLRAIKLGLLDEEASQEGSDHGDAEADSETHT